ncbi:hypothetical protein BGZ67_000272 [Mortierella alpina]|nr:hypothetical protein BGZ67_000272 [Mortierella alpina]
MPPRQRMVEIKNIVDMGRELDESYRQFAMRVQRDILMLGIEDSNSVILDSLQHKVPDDIYNTMLIALRIEKQRTKFTSIKEYNDILFQMSGPTTDIGSIPGFANHGAPRGQRYNAAGPSRNPRQRQQQRFNPAVRPQAQVHNNMRPQQPVTPPAPFSCDTCGVNYTHATEACVKCMFCNKLGHTADECRGRLRSEANAGGSNAATAPNNSSGSYRGSNARGRGGYARGGRGRGANGPNRR